MSGYARWMEKSFIAGTFPPEHRAIGTISGTPTVGQVLTMTSGAWTNSPSSFGYQWLRGPGPPWTNIGTNASTYTLVAGDSGFPVRCQVTAVNAAGSTTGPPSDAVRVA
jgi:hypothetical protein